jgi:hypothetical protein
MRRTLGFLTACAIMAAPLAAMGAASLEKPAPAPLNVQKAPPGADYREVCNLVKLPCFIPRLGTLYVNPKTLPEGPFLAYDHSGKLVSTVYMILLQDLNAQKAWADLSAPRGYVHHISINFNAGHPGVPDPHYHIVLWHVPKAEEQLVSK